MKILIIGNEPCAEELKTQLPASNGLSIYSSNTYAGEKVDLIFLMHNALEVSLADMPIDTFVIASSVIQTLASIPNKSHSDAWCGMNLLPGFISMPLKEVCGSPNALLKFDAISHQFGWKYKVVPDTPGFIALRVLSMIINEAVATFAENTASVEDIDIAMKLGTNYPIGPMAWCDKIGADVIALTLQHLFKQTGNPRYIANKLLLDMAKDGKSFYSQSSVKIQAH